MPHSGVSEGNNAKRNMKIGVDLGGTNVRVGLIDQGQLVRKVTALCPKGEEQEVLDVLLSLIRELMSDAVTSIGVGVPSVVDRDKGIVYNAANIPSWKEVHLRQILEDAFHKLVFINNDANCFALGEYLFGEGQNHENMVGLTVGTGIGAGLILNGQLYNGCNTGAGEIGALPFREADYERYCASKFFTANYKAKAQELEVKAHQGDKQALKAWQEFGNNLGCLMEAILYAYDPDLVVLGGGITAAFPFFGEAIYQRLSLFPWQESVKRLHIVPSKLQDAALLGAAMLDD
jgi:glucokinase